MSTPLKLAQLAALPAVFVVVSLAVSPRHPRAVESLDVSAAPARPADRFFSGGAIPAIPIALAPVAPLASAPAIQNGSGAWFQVTVVAELADEDAATRTAHELRGLLEANARHFDDPSCAEARARLVDDRSAAPIAPPELAAFERRALRPEQGIGWAGSATHAASGVLQLGRLVLVPHLKGDFAGLKKHPLASYVSSGGARARVEGDPASREPIVVDLVCTAPDEATARALARSLDAYFAAATSLFLLPPWSPTGVTPEQLRARTTFVSIERAITSALREPSFFRAVNERAYGSRDPRAIQEAIAKLTRETSLRALETVARRDDADPAIVDELRSAVLAQKHFEGWRLDPAAKRRLSERLGAPPLEVVASGTPGDPPRLEPARDHVHGATGRVQVDGRRVALGGLVFQRIARGLPALLAHLGAAGCTDARIALGDRVPHFPVETDFPGYDLEDD